MYFTVVTPLNLIFPIQWMVNGVFGAHGVHVQLHVGEEPMTGTDSATIHQLKMEAWIAQALVMKVHFAMIMTVQVSNS